MSTDGQSWLDLTPTTNASTSVSGLTPATVHYFRGRNITRHGWSDWCVPVSLIVT